MQPEKLVGRFLSPGLKTPETGARSQPPPVGISPRTLLTLTEWEKGAILEYFQIHLSSKHLEEERHQNKETKDWGIAFSDSLLEISLTPAFEEQSKAQSDRYS